MYAKLNEKGFPEFQTKRYIRSAGKLILNPTEGDMRAFGYKPLKATPPPECREGEILSISYIDKGDYIEEFYSIMEAE